MHLRPLCRNTGSANTPNQGVTLKEDCMIEQEYERREKLLAKLTSVRSDLHEAFRLATMLSEPMRNKLASVIVDVQDLLHECE